MQLGMCSWSHHRDFESGAMDLFDWMTVCAKDLRVHGIEITDEHMQSTEEDYIKTVKRVAVDLNLMISAVTVSNDFGLETEEARNLELEKVEKAIKLTKDLGSPMLRVFAGWPSHNKEEQWAEMVRCMQVACLVADREGIVLAVENHNHGGFLQTGEDIHRIITDVDSEWLRLNLDTGNYIDGWQSIEKTLIYTVQVHAKMMDIQKDGQDFTTDYPTLIKLLREKNYRGYVSLEYEGEEASLPAVARGVEFLRGLMAKNI